MRILYLGLEVPKNLQNAIHYPIIKIVPTDIESNDVVIAFRSVLDYTHFVFTSKTAVDLFFKAFARYGYHPTQLNDKLFYSVGRMTTACLNRYGIFHVATADEETAEGVVKILTASGMYFWPHSAKSRPILKDFFEKNELIYRECILYDTIFSMPGPLPDGDQFDEILFTSPSTVDAFLFFFKTFPFGKKLSTIGTVTKHYLTQMQKGQNRMGRI